MPAATASGSMVVTVLVDASELNAGTYNTDISVTAPNAANSPQKIQVTLTVTGLCKPEIVLNRRLFSFGAVGETGTCIPQTFLIDNGGPGTLNWTVTSNVAWLNFSPASGIGAGQVLLSLNNTSKELPAGTYFGTVTVNAPGASNSPQIVLVSLAVHNTDAQPFGEFATPTDGATVFSSIPLTGWILDDVGVERVTIYRHDENAENGLAYVGDALLVEGARPDVEDAYPQYPLNYKAGWGYMMLTNALPPNGNGSYVLEAIARDCSGTEVTLGTKTITVDNVNAVKPFGAIDTPSQGGDASGHNYRNQGWALTPIPNKLPEDGSTIVVYVDGVNLGSPIYDIPRSDVKTLFPGYLNSEGPGGYFDFDTTKYANGVHTIAWVAVDNVGNADGIGSRYFNILNLGLGGGGGKILKRYSEVENIETDYLQAVDVKKGFGRDALLQKIYPDNSGVINIEIKELEKVDIIFGAPVFNISTLPVGSKLDQGKGIFHWQPGPGFLGPYEFTFCTTAPLHRMLKKKIKITIVPIS
ncbi:MAG: Ig-like domain-containing protein [Acidobacteria bacterium]|nr:Ig-like domain-containing protein [Acidobacteriota bacterium]